MSTEDTVSDAFDIDELCEKFESVWNPDSAVATQICKQVDDIRPELRSRLVVELVATEYELRTERGLSVNKREFSKQLPNYRTEIDTAFAWCDSALPDAAGLSETVADSSAQRQTLSVSKIGDFQIVDEIGRGGMGVVYEAIQQSLDRRVAIKVLMGHPLHLPQLKDRFNRETKAVGALHHSNIVDVYGSGEEDGTHYFAMQLVNGDSLDHLINKRRVETNDDLDQTAISASSSKQIARWGVQVASALAYAHERGILHRDIKPANLLLDESGQVQVTDFGLAKLMNEGDDLTRTGDVLGTLRYMSPEAINGQWDERCDIFSLAATLYELVSLQPIYTSSNRLKIVEEITRAEPTPLSRITRGVARDLETIIHKGLSRSPSERYQSASAMAADLQRYIDGEPIYARRTSPAEQLWKWACRKPALAALVATVFLVASVGLPTLSILLKDARDATSLAKQKSAEADRARESERDEKVKAKKARDDAEALQYSSVIQLAGRYAQDGVRSELFTLLGSVMPADEGGESTASRDYRGWEWEYLAQQYQGSLHTLRGLGGPVKDIEISPDGKQLASAGGRFSAWNSSPGQVILWNLKTREKQHVLDGFASGVTGVSYSPDGSRLAAIAYKELVDEDGTGNGRHGSLEIWDPKTGKRLKRIPLEGSQLKRSIAGYYRKPTRPGAQFTPDGSKVICWPSPVELRDLETGKRIWEMPGTSAEILPNQKHVAVCGLYEWLHILDLATGKKIKGVKVPNRILDIRVDADTNQLIATSKDNVVLVDLNNYQVQSIASRSARFATIEPGNQHHYWWSDASGVLRRTSMHDFETVQSKIGHSSEVTDMVFDQSKRLIYTSSMEGTIKVWETESSYERVYRTSLGPRTGEFTFIDDGKSIAFAAVSNPGSEAKSGWIRLDRRAQQRFEYPVTFAAGSPRNDFAFSADGKYLAAPTREKHLSRTFKGHTHHEIGVYDTKTGRQLGSVETPIEVIKGVAWSDDRRQLAIGGYEYVTGGVLTIYQVDSSTPEDIKLTDGKNIDLSGMGSHNEVTSVDFHPDGDLIAVAQVNDVHVFRVSDGSHVRSVKTTGNRGHTHVDYSPDGNKLAVAYWEANQVRVYDSQLESQLYQADTPQFPYCVKFSPDSSRLAITDSQSSVYLCNAENGSRLLTLRGSKRSNGGSGYNARVVFSPDGRKIATNNWLGEFTVWSVSD